MKFVDDSFTQRNVNDVVSQTCGYISEDGNRTVEPEYFGSFLSGSPESTFLIGAFGACLPTRVFYMPHFEKA